MFSGSVAGLAVALAATAGNVAAESAIADDVTQAKLARMTLLASLGQQEDGASFMYRRLLPRHSEPAPGREPAPDMSMSAKESLGCAVAGISGIAVAIAAGGENLVNVIAGGLVVPANPVVLHTSLVGVVFASFCVVGLALTRLYLCWIGDPVVREPSLPGGATQDFVPRKRRDECRVRPVALRDPRFFVPPGHGIAGEKAR